MSSFLVHDIGSVPASPACMQRQRMRSVHTYGNPCQTNRLRELNIRTTIVDSPSPFPSLAAELHKRSSPRAFESPRLIGMPLQKTTSSYLLSFVINSNVSRSKRIDKHTRHRLISIMEVYLGQRLKTPSKEEEANAAFRSPSPNHTFYQHVRRRTQQSSTNKPK